LSTAASTTDSTSALSVLIPRARPQVRGIADVTVGSERMRRRSG
jgi:hypothetical protein